MIKSIELKNWKTHKHTQIEFQKGVNVLVGVMGAGKSSVMDALSYALFGTFPNLVHRRSTVNDLIMNRPSEEKNAEVSLVFEVEGNEYVVRRKISADASGEARLDKNGKYLQAQPQKVTETVQELLKVDYDTFSRAIYAEQNQLDYFLDLTKGDRKKQIDGMLGLDSFSAAEENVVSLINTTRTTIEDEEQVLEKIDIGEFKTQLGKLVNEKAGMEKQHIAIAAEVKGLDAQLSKLDADLRDAKAQYEKKKKFAEEIMTVKSRISTLEDEIKKIDALKINEGAVEKELASSRKAILSLEKELETIRIEEKARTKELSDAESSVKRLEKDIEAKKKILSEIKEIEAKEPEKALEEHTKALERFKEENISSKNSLAEAKMAQKELDKHISKCPVCESTLTDDRRESLLNEKTKQIKEFEARFSESVKRISDIDGKLKKAKQEADELNKRRERIKEYSEADKEYPKIRELLERKSKGMKEASRIFELKNKEYNAAKDGISRIESEMKNIERKRTYIKEIHAGKKGLEEKNAENDRIKVDDKTIYLIQEQVTAISSKRSDLNSRAEGNRKYTESLKGQIEDKEKSIGTFDRIEAKIRTKREMVGNLNKFKGALIETEAMLRNRLISSVNGIMKGVWPELYPYGDYSEIRLEAMKDDYLLQTSIAFRGNESWVPIDMIASGGERSIACLTMRIALSMVIVPNLKWIILDEPTHNIDSNGIDKLVNVLSTNLPRVVEQVFIITHDDALKQINGAAIFQLERDKNAHGATAVSSV